PRTCSSRRRSRASSWARSSTSTAARTCRRTRLGCGQRTTPARGARQAGAMVLRLDPAIPLVWRDPHTLQFGVDPAVTVLRDVAPAVEHLIAVLAAGVSRSGYRM